MSAPQYEPKRNPQQPIDPAGKKKKKYPLSEDRGRDKRHERDPEEDRDRDDDKRPNDDEHRMLGGEA